MNFHERIVESIEIIYTIFGQTYAQCQRNVMEIKAIIYKNYNLKLHPFFECVFRD